MKNLGTMNASVGEDFERRLHDFYARLITDSQAEFDFEGDYEEVVRFLLKKNDELKRENYNLKQRLNEMWAEECML